MKIKVKCNDPNCMPSIASKGDWIDLHNSEEVVMYAPQAGSRHSRNGEKVRDVTFDFHLVPLGVAMELPKGFEAVIVPRSSTFKRYGLLQANSMGGLTTVITGIPTFGCSQPFPLPM